MDTNDQNNANPQPHVRQRKKFQIKKRTDIGGWKFDEHNHRCPDTPMDGFSGELQNRDALEKCAARSGRFLPGGQ
jgi:hypothetical protein